MIRAIVNIFIVTVLLYGNNTYCYGEDMIISDSSSRDSTRFMLGIMGGYLYNQHTEAYFQNTEHYCVYKIPNAVGNGYYVGLNFKYLLDSNALHSIGLRLTYNNMNAQYSTLGDNFSSITYVKYPEVPFPVPKLVTTGSEFNADMNFSDLTFNLFYSMKISNNFPLEISAGPYFTYLIKNDFREIYSLINPPPGVRFDFDPNYKYLNNFTSVILWDKEINYP
jgi:hypothetical protein